MNCCASGRRQIMGRANIVIVVEDFTWNIN